MLSPVDFSGTVSAPGLRGFIAEIRRAGGDVPALLDALGVGAAVFDDPNGRVPGRIAAALLEEAQRLTRDPALGLHIAERYLMDTQNLLTYLMHSSKTVGEAWQLSCRYFRLFQDGLTLNLVTNASSREAALELCVPHFIPRDIPEMILANIVLHAHGVIDGGLNLQRIELRHAAPADTSEHERIFATPLVFSAGRNALVFERSVLEQPLVSADPTLAIVLEGYASTLVDQLPRAGTFVDDVRRVVHGELRAGEPRAEVIARKLGMSTRTLHRRLRQQEQTFRKLVDAVREQVGLSLLTEADHPLAEIAFLLGYSDPSAFHRAFKRWTGETPAEYRLRMAEA